MIAQTIRKAQNRPLLPFVGALLALVALCIGLVGAHGVRPPGARGAALPPDQAVQRAWDLVRQSGSYDFNAEVVQTISPVASVANIGQTSRQESARLEGHANLATQGLNFTLWSKGGSVLDASSGIEVRTEGDQAYVRKGGGPWQAVDGFTGSFAPQSDFMAFLSAAKDIQFTGEETVGGVTAGRYTFSVDGPGFARYMRDNMEETLQKNGKLPPGLTLSLSHQYSGMTGQGVLWLGQDGLPLRQELSVAFAAPKPSVENPAPSQVSAEITVSLSNYGLLAAQANPTPLWGGFLERDLLPGLPLFHLLAGLLFLCAMLIVFRASRRFAPLYAALIVVLIAAMVIGPLLQQAQAAGFVRAQSARQQAQAQQSEQQRQAAGIQQRLSAPRISPNVSPLESAQARLAIKNAQSAAVGAGLKPALLAPLTQLPADTPPQLQADPGTDSDKDGLTDVQEGILGTDELSPDTDDDTITDTVEVAGFLWPPTGTTRYYGDPRNADTNNDGISDKEEWQKDTDGDGNPDLWSLDNDGDGIPDNIDLSPFTKVVQGFSQTTPFNLSFTDLKQGKYTYVEMQIRPTNLSHLRYAYNVFDWPKGDVSGQLMDDDGKTFKDVNPDSDSPQDANGDVKLVPMLEVTIQGASTNLPSEQVLQGYGITVRELTSDGSQKAVYIPLQVVTDQGDQRVAFYAKMVYLPGISWGNAQQYRMIWGVQALVDTCKEDSWKDNKCQAFERYNELQLVQTYYDTFNITGFNVREDHGADYDIIYQDPAVMTGSLNQFDTLSDLAYGLDHTFLAGRRKIDGTLDPTVDEIRLHFDHSINAGVPISPTRFNIQDNILSVTTLKYAHLDEALHQISVTETKRILDAHYTPVWSAANPVTPTVMFAHEERYRPLNLDMRTNNLVWSLNSLTVKMTETPAAGSGIQAIEEHTLTGVNWAPYMYSAGAWTAIPIEDYLNSLATIYPFETMYDTLEEATGALMYMKTYYANIYQGYSSIVEIGGFDVIGENVKEDEELSKWAEYWESVREPDKILLEAMVEMEVMGALENALKKCANFFIEITAEANGFPILQEDLFEIESMHAPSKGMIFMTLFAITAIIISMIPAVNEWMHTTLAGQIFTTCIGLTIGGLGLAKTIQLMGKYMAAGDNAAFSSFRASAEMSMKAFVIMTVIMVLIDVGFFIYGVVSNHVKAFSLEFDAMLAELIASIIVLLIFTAIAEIPIFGPLIVGIIGMIDMILSAFLGTSLTGWLTKLIAAVIYNNDPMEELDADAGATAMTLDKPLGISQGNTLTWSFPMTTTVTQLNPQSWMPNLYPYLWTQASLLSTSIHYSLDTSSHDVGAERGDMTSVWAPLVEDHKVNWHTYYRTSKKETLSKGSVGLPTAGINQETTLWLDMGYSVPTVECWLAIVVPVCYRRSADGQNPQELPKIILDVFPTTVDLLVGWTWNNNKGLYFPTPKDVDGDGLNSFYAGGSDPDDTKWDTDGDYLSDYFELQMSSTPLSQGGAAFNPLLADSDNDLLRDNDELRLGTDPAHVDTDNDGRSDYLENSGYLFTYASGKQTLVRSKPTTPDFDADGMNDYFEYTLSMASPLNNAFNPNVWNHNPLQMHTRLGPNSNFVAPGARVPVTTTLYSDSESSTPIRGVLTTTMPVVAGGGGSVASYELNSGATVTETSAFNILAGIPSQTATVGVATCANLVKPLVFLPLDEAAGATTFSNKYSTRYTGACQGKCPVAGNSGPAGLGSAVRLYGEQGMTLQGSAPDLEFSGMQPFSIAAWIKLDQNAGSDQYVVSAVYDTNDQGIYHNLSGWYYLSVKPGLTNLEFSTDRFKANAAIPAGTALLNTWNNVIAIWDGRTPSIYLNGVLLTSQVGATGLQMRVNPPASQVMIGTSGASYSYFRYPFYGSLDDIYIFDRALGADEIAEIAFPLTNGLQSAPTCDLYTTNSQAFTVDADNPSSVITSLRGGQYLNVTGTLVIGGSARDATSGIGAVQVAVDKGTWQPASGASSWAYAWDTHALSEGPHTLSSRAVDVVGNYETSPGSIGVIIDRKPPVITTAGPMTFAQLDPTGNWVVHLGGTVSDPNVGIGPGSGVKSMYVLLSGDQGVAGSDWQAATVYQNTWSLDYRLPGYNNQRDRISDPSGNYTLSAYAVDNAGNRTPEGAEFLRTLGIDNRPPVAAVTYTGPSNQNITQAVTLSGVITDPGEVASGVQSLQVSFVPASQVAVYSGTVMMLHLNEAAGAMYFDDASGQYNPATCSLATCPSAGKLGKIDGAVQFTAPTQQLIAADSTSQQLIDTLSVAVWFNTSYASLQNAILVQKGSGTSYNYKMYWKTGGLSFELQNKGGGKLAANSGVMYNDGAWHQAVGVWDGKTVYLYVDGSLVDKSTGTYFSPLATVTLPTTAGLGYVGYMDEVMVNSSALDDQEVRDLLFNARLTWYPATLAASGLGVANTTWTLPLPTTLEGIYQINLRGTDLFNNRQNSTLYQNSWRGLIDVLAPRVNILKQKGTWSTTVDCSAVDFNLTTKNYACPCPVLAADQSTYDVYSNWYRSITTDTTRLYVIQPHCKVDADTHTPSTTACDTTGRCSTATSPTLEGEPADEGAGVGAELKPALTAAGPSAEVVTPAGRTVLTNTLPISLSVGADALASLSVVTLTLDGELQYIFTYPAGVTHTLSTTTWTPPGGLTQGLHTFQTTAADLSGTVQAVPYTSTIILDSEAPEIDFSNLVLTTTHALPYAGVNLTGTLTETAGVPAVEVSIDGGEWLPGSAEGSTWRYPWGMLPGSTDGTYQVSARATDVAGRQVTETASIVVDLSAPAPITPSLSAFNGIEWGPVLPGSSVRQPLNPTLAITWTASSDLNGPLTYYAGFVPAGEAVPSLEGLTPYTLEPYRHEQVLSEAHAYDAVVVAVDAYGNRSENRAGPVFIDTRLTPDLIELVKPQEFTLPFQESSCTQIGLSRVVSESIDETSSLSGLQTLRYTWDDQAMRLQWDGANWDTAGNLFVLFDTLPGQGIHSLVHPLSSTQVIDLPGAMAADYLVWVSSSSTAELYAWDGSQWGLSGDHPLPGELFATDTGLRQTALRLPFDRLSIADPATAHLEMVAIAADMGTLQPWTVFPTNNSHSSSRLGLTEGDTPLQLRSAYIWDGLGGGVCPNLDRYTDVDLRLQATSVPTFTVAADRLGSLVLAAPQPQGYTSLYLREEQPVTFTLTISNAGQDDAQNIVLKLAAYGALVFPGGEIAVDGDDIGYYTQTLNLPGLSGGATQEVQVPALVNTNLIRSQESACLEAHPGDPGACQKYTDLVRLARLDAHLYSGLAPQAPQISFTSYQTVDIDPPHNVAVTGVDGQGNANDLLSPAEDGTNAPLEAFSQPPFFVQNGEQTLEGSAEDPSSVVRVELSLLKPDGDEQQVECPFLPPVNDTWRCQMDIPAGQDGERFFVRARATDALGYTSEWSAWRVLVVDTTAPSLNLDDTSEARLSVPVRIKQPPQLHGLVLDNHQPGGVEVCVSLPIFHLPHALYLPAVSSQNAVGPASSAPTQVENTGNYNYPGACRTANLVDLRSDAGTSAVADWLFELIPPFKIDGAYQIARFTAVDAAGNRAAPLYRTYHLDSLGPRLELLHQDFSVSLSGFLQHPTPVLSGTLLTTSRLTDLFVLASSEMMGRQRYVAHLPNGSHTEGLDVTATPTGANWSFTPQLEAAGSYTFHVFSRDAAGNASWLGIYHLQVVNNYLYWIPAVSK